MRELLLDLLILKTQKMVDSLTSIIITKMQTLYLPNCQCKKAITI